MLSELVQVWLQGGRIVRSLLIIATLLFVLALVTIFAEMLLGVTIGIAPGFPVLSTSAVFLASISLILAMFMIGYRRALEQTKRDERIQAVERRYAEHPKETQVIWELARSKLENYVDRNLDQVRSIFWITIIIMLFGFFLIAYGVFKAYQTPDNFKPSIVATCSGILVNFIGATFLIIYKSTMVQAREYVTVLERINAIGMSVQILEKLDESETELREKTTAELSKELLTLYAAGKNK